MKTWVRRSLNAGALTAGALLVSGAAAQASPTMVSSDNVGLLNGTQALIPVQVPVNVCGNAVAVAGAAYAECEGGATALNPEWRFDHFRAGTEMTSTGNIGALTGTQVQAPVQVPVNVCGNAVAVLGGATASCDGGAQAGPGAKKPGPKKPGQHKPGYGQEKPDQDEPGYGYQPDPDQSGHGKPGHGKPGHGGPGHGGGADQDPTMVSSGNVGLLNGTQVLAPVQVPIDICGNAIGVLGLAQAGCEGGASAR